MKGTQIEQKKREEELFLYSARPFFGEMRGWCTSLAGSAWDGDDLFQNSMIKLYRAWVRRPSRPITKAYLYRIVSNTWIDGHRKVSIDETVTDSMERFAGEEGKKQTADRLTEAMKVLIEELSAKQRLIFLLIAGMDYRAAEAAEMIGESESNVRVIYHRARKKLASCGRVFPVRDRDELADRYVAAFQSRLPERLLYLYRQETRAALGPVSAAFNQLSAATGGLNEKVRLMILACLHGAYERPDGKIRKIFCTEQAA